MSAGVSGIFPIIGIMNGGGGNGLSPTRAGTGKPLGAIEGTNAQHHWPFIFPTFWVSSWGFEAKRSDEWKHGLPIQWFQFAAVAVVTHYLSLFKIQNSQVTWTFDITRCLYHFLLYHLLLATMTQPETQVVLCGSDEVGGRGVILEGGEESRHPVLAPTEVKWKPLPKQVPQEFDCTNSSSSGIQTWCQARLTESSRPESAGGCFGNGSGLDRQCSHPTR